MAALSVSTQAGTDQPVPDVSAVSISEPEPRQVQYAPRTFDYDAALPYDTSSTEEALDSLHQILQALYSFIEAGDSFSASCNCTYLLGCWLNSKHQLPQDIHIQLTKVYYDLCLSPGIEHGVAKRFLSTFGTLVKYRRSVLEPQHLVLNWRPLWKIIEIRYYQTSSLISVTDDCSLDDNEVRALCHRAQKFFDRNDRLEIFEKCLSKVWDSRADGSIAPLSHIGDLMPYWSPVPGLSDQYPQRFLPSIFHLWSIFSFEPVTNYKIFTLLAKMTRQTRKAVHVPFDEFGIFTKDQWDVIFSNVILNMCLYDSSSENIAYSYQITVEALRERNRGIEVAAGIIAHSISGQCEGKTESVLTMLETLLNTVEAFYHPSLPGWHISLLIYYLSTAIINRWNSEERDNEIPPHRRLTRPVIRKIVLLMRNFPLIGIFSKQADDERMAQQTLSTLAELEPSLILPHALRLIYPALQDSSPVHRTVSCIAALCFLAPVMCRTRGYRCHIPFIMELLLPSIDPNDTSKTRRTLRFLQTVSQLIPLHNLNDELLKSDPNADIDTDSFVAQQWFQLQTERLEDAPADFSLDYTTELTEAEEERILRQSTMALDTYVQEVIKKLFRFLKNSEASSDSVPENGDAPTYTILRLATKFFFSSLSPELFDVALETLSKRIHDWSLQKARAGVAAIVKSATEASPERVLAVLLPQFITNIQEEIIEKGAGTSPNFTSDILPRDQRLMYYLHILPVMFCCGWALGPWFSDIRSINNFVLERCCGTIGASATGISNCILSDITSIYPKEYAIFDKEVPGKVVSAADWGVYEKPNDLKINWYIPDKKTLSTAIEMYSNLAEQALAKLNEMIGPEPPISPNGAASKQWTDVVVRNICLLQELIESTSFIADIEHIEGNDPAQVAREMEEVSKATEGMDLPDYATKYDTSSWDHVEFWDKNVRPRKNNKLRWKDGYLLDRNSAEYKKYHDIRFQIGICLHRVHRYLSASQQDNFKAITTINQIITSYIVDISIPCYNDYYSVVRQFYYLSTRRFRTAGTRKRFPRSCLIQRAYLHHLHSKTMRSDIYVRSPLHIALLNDLFCSSIFSNYKQIREEAQYILVTALDKLPQGNDFYAKLAVDVLEKAAHHKELHVLKGVMYTAGLEPLSNSIEKDWNLTGRVALAYLRTLDLPNITERLPGINVDLFTAHDVANFKSTDSVKEFGEAIFGAGLSSFKSDIEQNRLNVEACLATQDQVRASVTDRVQDLLTENSSLLNPSESKSQWSVRKVITAMRYLESLDVRYQTGASDKTIDLILNGIINSEPTIRNQSLNSVSLLMSHLSKRVLIDFKEENQRLSNFTYLGSKVIPVTEELVQTFYQTVETDRNPEYFVDSYPGWLLWPQSIRLLKADMPSPKYPELDRRIRSRISSHFTRDWFTKLINFAKVETAGSREGLRISYFQIYVRMFAMIFNNDTSLSLDDVATLMESDLGKESDQNCHRVKAELLTGLLLGGMEGSKEARDKAWKFGSAEMVKIFSADIPNETRGYWLSLVQVTHPVVDPRRPFPLYDYILQQIGTDVGPEKMLSHQTKLAALESVMRSTVFRNFNSDPIEELTLSQLCNPYRAVRTIIASILETYILCQYNPSYRNLQDLMNDQNVSSVGKRAFIPPPQIENLFERLVDLMDEWRAQHQPNQTEATLYRRGAHTVLETLSGCIGSAQSQLVTNFVLSSRMFSHLLFITDMKEDPELQALAVSILFSLPWMPFPQGQEGPLIENIIQVAKTSTNWHHRLYALSLVPALHYYRHFSMQEQHKHSLYELVVSMLFDQKVDVRRQTSKVLAAIVQSMLPAQRLAVIAKLEKDLGSILRRPVLKAGSRKRRADNAEKAEGGAEESEEYRELRQRHGAVLGLGSLLLAFPFASPPPRWMAAILDLLATRSMGNGNIVSRSAKWFLSEFRKTRQDTWFMDMKVFTSDELANLEGVVQVSYYA